ncbi:MAG: YbhN family protein, partial [Pseudomonadota bacterium]
MRSGQDTRAVARPGRPAGLAWGRIALSGLLAAGLVWLLVRRLAGVDPGQVADSLALMPPRAWGLALLATAISFWAAARHDGAIHRHLGTGCDPRRVRRAGFAAIAVSQTIGLGLITGALVRWRMLPGLGLWQATRITGAVTVSFLAGWSVVTATTLTLLPGAPFQAAALVVLGVAGLALIGLALSRLPLPHIGTAVVLLLLAAVDTLMAGVALWALMPGDMALATLMPAFLLAYGAGLVSGSPAGVGAFELCLLALLPPHPEAAGLAAILAFRAVYYAGPAILGGALLLTARPDVAARIPDLRHGFAEAQLLHQGQLHALPLRPDSREPAGHLMTGRLALCLVALRDPIGKMPPATALRGLRQAARAQTRWPVLYKCPARLAVAARRAGFAVRLVAKEAWLQPGSFSLTTPAR